MEIEKLLIELEKEYKRLAKLWHPDHQPLEKQEQATRQMQWLNNLYNESKKLLLKG